MRLAHGHGALCHRSREWISLRLDGELSELAAKMLDAHLARCAECRAFEAGVAAATRHVRTAPLEHLEQPISLPRGRRLAFQTRRVGAAVAAAAGIAIGLVAFLTVPSSNTLASRSPSIVAPSGNQDLEQFRLFRAAALKPVVRPPRPVRGPQKT
jgi:anti-sigma factor RsiW